MDFKASSIARCLLALCLLLGSGLAAAQPRDILLVLDNSGSMKRNDPARLTADAVRGFITRQAPDTRVGIMLFADNPRLVAPLTDVNAAAGERVVSSLGQLNYSGRWTEIAEAVERAIYELRVNGREDALKAVVLMTDGIIDTGNAERDRIRSEWLRSSLVLEAQRHDIRIYGLAFTEQADFLLLQFLAQATGGEYFRALVPEDLAPVLGRIEASLDRAAATAPANAAAAEPAAPANEPPAAEAQPEPERIVYTGPAAEDRPAEPAARDGTADHGVLLWLLAGLAVLFLLAGAGWWALRHWNAAGLLQGEKAGQEDHGPRAVLYDVHDPSDIKRYELAARPVVIGRVGGSDPAMDYIVVEERTVGRWHATIERRGQSFWIRDEGSVNGTFVNENRVTTEHPLKHGDMVRVHKHEFEFVIPELFDSDRTVLANERTRARAVETARATTTGRQTVTGRG